MGDLATAIALRNLDSGGTQRYDGWSNIITALNLQGRDKRTGANFQSFAISPTDCEEFYRGDDVAARVVDLPAREMTRKWLDVLVQDDEAGFSKEMQDMCADEFQRLNVQELYREARQWADVFGGSGLLVGAADGQENAIMPMDLKNVESVDWLTLLDARELIAVNWYGDVAAPKYGDPQVYRIQPLTLDLGAAETLASESIRRLELQGLWAEAVSLGKGLVRYVHESRIIRFEGVRLTRRQMRRQRGWGDSKYVRMAEEIRDFQSSFDSIANLLTDFAQPVYKVKGLAEIIGSPQGGQTFLARLQALDAARSIIRALVLDAEGEEFERKATPIAGLAELIDKFMLRLAAAAELPVALLMGQSPAGLNATGDSDIRWFYDRMASLQEREIAPAVKRLLEILFAAKSGPFKGVAPKKWSIDFRPLWQMDDSQVAKIHLDQAQADAIYIDRQVVTPEMITKSRFGGAKYSLNTQIDLPAIQKMSKATPPKKPGEVPPAGPNDKVKPKAQPSFKAPDPGESAPPEGQQRKPAKTY